MKVNDKPSKCPLFKTNSKMLIQYYVKMFTTIFYFEFHNVYFIFHYIFYGSLYVLHIFFYSCAPYNSNIFILARDFLYTETKMFVTIYHRTHPEISETKTPRGQIWCAQAGRHKFRRWIINKIKWKKMKRYTGLLYAGPSDYPKA